MIKDITLGQYYPSGSILHKLDPRVKVMGALIYIISLFIFKGKLGYIATTAFLIFLIMISLVPFSYMIKGLKTIIIFMVFTALINLFMTPGEPVFTIWKLTISKEGIEVTARMIIRLISLILGTSIMTFTTTPNQLTDALERLFRPLKIFRFPVHEIAMMMSIALSFIPILVEELDIIMKAQKARGADFDDKRFTKRVKALIPVLVPLFVSAFRRANDLALAMDSRCYRGGDGRTKMRPLVYHKKDIMAYLILLLYLAIVIVMGRL
ncbi:MAG: energy-coupling factor transporter transmembrane protein EcfT [Lachnospiraceae bacterium]|nr:energy-coupling factor transporter transmembrane protein EcfT [Lachnospiraceae bacterium]